MPARYYIGTSGWHYNHWKGRFYPEKLSKADWLEFYSRYFNSVELNASFYRLPSKDTFVKWRESVPAGFIFAVKVSRFITHIKRLKESQEPLNTFIEKAVEMKSNLGPLLYQLPPGMHRDDERLEGFLSLLNPNMKHVFEFRHKSWFEEGIFQILRKYKAGFCIFDMPDLTSPLVVTANFAYMRFHGSGGLYSSNYSDKELLDWAEKLTALASAFKEVYIYFNNDAEAFAIKNAMTLRSFLSESRVGGKS